MLVNFSTSSKVICQVFIVLLTTASYLSFSPREECGDVEAVREMELCVNDIRSWTSKDKLLKNDEKTEFLIIGTRQQYMCINVVCCVGRVEIQIEI